MDKEAIKKLFQKNLLSVPQVSYAFAYGSTAVPQRGYDVSHHVCHSDRYTHDYTQKTGTVDLILCVDDISDFHAANLVHRRHHYSMIRHFGVNCIKHINEWNAGLYFLLGKIHDRVGITPITTVLSNVLSLCTECEVWCDVT